MTSDGIFPWPKHPVKVHIWAGISMRDRTGICIFVGIMDTSVYVDILDRTLVPFLKEVHSDGNRFMQANDPKHISRLGKHFLADSHIT